MKSPLTLSISLGAAILLTSCGDPNPQKAPIKETPTGAKVDLTGVSLIVDEASIVKTGTATHELRFEYTIENTSGSNIQFPSVYPNMDHLIEVTLTDANNEVLPIVKNSMAGLTLAQPNPRRILVGKSTRTYTAHLIPNSLKPNDPVNVRVRLHVPSRYDELRSSLEAPTVQLTWPGETEKKKP